MLSRPIFVIGYMHSGTTLLLNILGKHSSVFASGGETKYFEHLPIIRRNYPHLRNNQDLEEFILFVADVIRYGYQLWNKKTNEDRPVVLTDEHIRAIRAQIENSKEHGYIFRIIFDYLTDMYGKSRWLEKTPTHIFQVEQILKYIPNAQFVEIVRDPRDILASKKTRRLTVWTDRYMPEQRSLKHLEKAYDPLWDSISWKAAIHAGRGAQKKYPDQILSIRYEDLVSNPELHVCKICAFLKMTFEPQMLSISTRNKAEWDKNENSADNGITNNSVGRWQNILENSEVALCQILLKTELDNIGYLSTPIRIEDKIRILPLVMKSVFEFFHRLVRRWRLGGYSYFANVLLNYWKRLLKLTYG